MVNATSAQSDVNAIINENGVTCRFRYFTPTITGSDFDNYTSLAKSGNDIWTSGLKQPLSSRFGNSDSILVEQGKLFTDDSKLYVKNDVQTSGVVKIQVGSPSGEQYQILNLGTVDWTINNTTVYKKSFIRVLPNGSIAGE